MDQIDYFKIFKRAVDVNGKDVLEIGGSVPWQEVNKAAPNSWTSINISTRYGQSDKPPVWFHEELMSAADMGRFSNASFDAVFSSNCFEHVDDVEAAFREIHRVLKPGGVFFTIFGPIWSGPVGHHLWIHGDSGQPITFNQDVLPPWGHLRYGRKQMASYLTAKGRWSAKEVERMLKYVYDSNDMNRNMDRRYLDGIKKLSFKPYISYRVKTKYVIPEETFAWLEAQYPEVEDFRTTTMFWVMAKGKWDLKQCARAYLGSALAFGLKAIGRG